MFPPRRRVTLLDNVWVRCARHGDERAEYVNCGTGVRVASRPTEGVGGAYSPAIWTAEEYLCEKQSFAKYGKGIVLPKKGNCGYSMPCAGAHAGTVPPCSTAMLLDEW